MTNKILSFFAYYRKKIRNKINFSYVNVDQKLVYGLSPKKIPNSSQFKHLHKFLKPREYLVVKVCILLIVVNSLYLGIIFFKNHLVYTPVAGGEYTEGLISYPKVINPLYAVNRDVDNDLSRLIYSSLFRYDKDGKLINDLVDNFIINDNKEYIIKIKDNVKWHNGDYLVIDDVIFTIEAIKNEEYNSPLKNLFNDAVIEKVDYLTIKIVLNSPYAPFLQNLTFGILPKNIWSKINPGSAILSEFNLRPIGSGPYKFKSLLKNTGGDLKEYNLVINEDYYLKKPYIKNIKFKFFINYAEAIKALNDNQIDGLGYLPFNERQELIAKDSLMLHELVRPQIFALFFNTEKDKALDNQVVRVSLAQALNKDKIIDDIFEGTYQKADGPIIKNNFAYSEEMIKYEYNPAEATSNIKNKLASTSITVVDSGRNVAVAEEVKKYWENIGVSVDLKIIPGEKASETIKNRDFEILFYGQSVGGDPDVYAFWHSSQAKSTGLNISNYKNTEADNLLTEARSTNDEAERISKYQKFQENIANNIPAIFLYSPIYTYVQSKKVKGFEATMIMDSADRFAGLSDWYLKNNKKLVW